MGDDFGGDEILVIQVNATGITEDDTVRVTGTVRSFDVAAFEREFGTDLHEVDLYDPWVDENVLVASNVTKLKGSESQPQRRPPRCVPRAGTPPVLRRELARTGGSGLKL